MPSDGISDRLGRRSRRLRWPRLGALVGSWSWAARDLIGVVSNRSRTTISIRARATNACPTPGVVTSPPGEAERSEPLGFACMPTESEVREVVRRVVAGIVPDVAPQPNSPQPSADAVTLAIGADHGGYPLKERLGFRLRESGYEVIDCGTDSSESVDYPDYAHKVARAVSEGRATFGIIVDGAGIGSAMVANKVPGIRAALCYDVSSARNSREHNHANVLTLGAGLIGAGLAWQITEEWLATPWGPGRHAGRVAKITDIERRYLKDGS